MLVVHTILLEISCCGSNESLSAMGRSNAKTSKTAVVQWKSVRLETERSLDLFSSKAQRYVLKQDTVSFA